MKLQAVIPEGAPSNALLRVRLPDGSEVNVRVPARLVPGDEFIFEVPDDEAPSSDAIVGEPVIRGGRGGGGGKGLSSPTSAAGGGSGKVGGGKSNYRQQGASYRNPKKRRPTHIDASNNGGGGGGFGSSSGRGVGGGGDPSSRRFDHDAGRVEGGPVLSFIVWLYNYLYSQYCDLLTQQSNDYAAATTPSDQHLTRQGSGGNNSRGGTAHQKSNSNINCNSKSSLTRPESQDGGGRLRRPSNNADVDLGFMDRDLSNGKDLMTALAVGTFIGISTIMGFLGGVLYATPPIQGVRYT